MQVLVTGGTGFVGSHGVHALQSAGHRVRLLVRSRDKAEFVFGDAQPAEVMTGDVVDPRAVAAALDGVEGVVHCAAVVATQARRAREVLDKLGGVFVTLSEEDAREEIRTDVR